MGEGVSGNEARLRAAYENRDPRLAAIAITPYSTYDGGASGSVVTYTSRYPYRDWQAPSPKHFSHLPNKKMQCTM